MNRVYTNNILLVIWSGTDFSGTIFPTDLIILVQELYEGKALEGRIWRKKKKVQ